MTTSSVRPLFLRDGAGTEDPLRAVHAFLKAPRRFDVSDPSRPASFGAVAGGLDGLPELLLGLVRADGDHEVVGQVSWQPRTQVRRQPVQGEGPAARLGPHVREREKATSPNKPNSHSPDSPVADSRWPYDY